MLLRRAFVVFVILAGLWCMGGGRVVALGPAGRLLDQPAGSSAQLAPAEAREKAVEWLRHRPRQLASPGEEQGARRGGWQYAEAMWVEAGRHIEGLVPSLIGLLEEPDPRVDGKWVVYALGRLGDCSCLPALVEQLNSDSKIPGWNTAKALDALGRLGDLRAVEPLCKAGEDDENDGLRAHAVRALGDLVRRPKVRAAMTPALEERVRLCLRSILESPYNWPFSTDAARHTERLFEGVSLPAGLRIGGEYRAGPVSLWEGDHNPEWAVGLAELGRAAGVGTAWDPFFYKARLDDIAWLYAHEKRQYLEGAGKYRDKKTQRRDLAGIFDSAVGRVLNQGDDSVWSLLNQLRGRGGLWLGLTGLERTLVQSLVVHYAEAGDREHLVELLSLYCPPTIHGTEIEAYLVGPGARRLADSILVLFEAFDRNYTRAPANSRAARHELMAALDSAFRLPFSALPGWPPDGFDLDITQPPLLIEGGRWEDFENWWVWAHRQWYLEHKGELEVNYWDYDWEFPLFLIRQGDRVEPH